ncbi:hypothetical protein [Hyphobacterium indicum]|uniref:hypothetical protein n=1 Tax=Hyphobacterium indicum TaxID=2162714 RepID=UPI000F63E68A|nr:hypothetical protein [Hyphobacterium indicum]
MARRTAKEFDSFENAIDAAFGYACTKFGFCSVAIGLKQEIGMKPEISALDLAALIVVAEGMNPLTSPHAGELEMFFESFFEGPALNRQDFA